MWELEHKKAEHQRFDAFKLWCWRRLLRVPWTAKRSNQSILKEINPEYSLEELMLKLQYFGHQMQRTNSLEKTLIMGKIKGKRRRGKQKRRWSESITNSVDIRSDQISRSVVSDSLRPHALQHAWLPCPSPSFWVCSKSCPLSRWCHPTISSSVAPFSCPQSFSASGSFTISRLFASGAQSIGASASVSVPSMNIQERFPLGLTGTISFRIDWFDLLTVQGTLKSLL